MKVLSLEEIYDATVDDDIFGSISKALAETLGGRSALLYWMHRDGRADILSHSGHFTDEQLQHYASNHASADPFVLATSGAECVNRALNLNDYVPAEHFIRSGLYDQFLRPIGDDTARCMGVRIDNSWGSGFISIQRGLSQKPFEQRNLDELNALFPHLRRMLTVRGRIASTSQHGSLARSALDTLGLPVFLVDLQLRLKGSNAAAETLLASQSALVVKNGVLMCPQQQWNGALRRAVHVALAKEGGASAVAVAAPQRLHLSVIGTAAAAGGTRLATIIAEAPAARDGSRKTRLQALYRLSSTEAAIALLLGDGLSPAEIADRRQVTLGTVRVQIKHIAAKLGCNRQSEIIRAVAALPTFSTAPSMGRSS